MRSAFFLLLAASLLLSSLTAHAQVPNDNIENRCLLQAEEIASSNTTGCTVQWSCVDEKLTGKCIEYHNDQWFEFRPQASGTYYVNIGQQKCRDVRGVQLVVLIGTPCQPATYRILACASLGTQDNLFVPLPHLQAGQAYLFNVNGYLKDYCGFTLQVSGQARGLPVQPTPVLPAGPPTTSRLVALSWQVPDSLPAVQYCRVLRREQHAFRSQELGRLPVARNTFGQQQAAYTFTDTLGTPGHYLYQVVAEADDPAEPPAVLHQQWVSYSQLRPIMPGAVGADVAHLLLPLGGYPRGAQLSVVISDPASGRVLRAAQVEIQPNQPAAERLYAQPWFEQGLRQVAVAITCRPRRGTRYTHHLLLPLVPPTPAR